MSGVPVALGGICQPGSEMGADLACLRGGSQGVVREKHGLGCQADLWPRLLSDVPGCGTGWAWGADQEGPLGMSGETCLCPLQSGLRPLYHEQS